MSWSVHLIGEPEKVVAALEEHSTKMEGKSKEEFDAALPHLIGLVKLNYAEKPPVIKISGSGHGHGTFSTCTVSIEHLGSVLV